MTVFVVCASLGWSADTALSPGALTAFESNLAVAAGPASQFEFNAEAEPAPGEAPAPSAGNDDAVARLFAGNLSVATQVAMTQHGSLTSLAPSSATAGGPGFVLTVNGLDLVAGATVLWNGAARSTTFVGSTQLTAQISAADIAQPGTASVSVRKPSSVETNALPFVIVAQTVTPVVSPAALNISALVRGNAARYSLQIGTTGASMSWTARLDQLNGPSGMVAISPPSGTATATAPSVVTVDVNPSAATVAGVYQFTITIVAGTTTTVVPVTVTLTAQARLVLSDESLNFSVGQGRPSPRPETLTLFSSGPGSVAWTIRVAAGDLQQRLTVSPSAGTAAPGVGSSVNVSVDTNGLQPGVLQNILEVTAGGEVRLVTVTAQVQASTSPRAVSVAPLGLVFTALQGGGAPAPKTIVVRETGGGGPVSFDVSVANAGSNILSVNPTSSSTQGGPVIIQVTASTGGLQAGLYRDTISVNAASGQRLQVEVLVVVASGPAAIQGMETFSASTFTGAQCTPQSIEVVGTTFGSGLDLPVTYPKVLQALLVDNCGNGVNNASVAARLDSDNVNLQSLEGGLYSGLWVPTRVVSTLPMVLTAAHPSFTSVVRRSYTLSVSSPVGGAELPVLTPDGVVEGAGFTPRRPLVPGGIISLFGRGLAAGDNSATRIPLDRELGGTSVRIGNLSAPLYYTSAGQVNAQVPYELAGSQSLSMVVATRGRFTAAQTYAIAPAQPGIFFVGTTPAITDPQYRLITTANPAHPGDTLVIFAAGLGAVDPPVATGEAATGLTALRIPVRITIGGVESSIAFQGLAPSLVGAYQVNVVVPASAPTGDAVPLVLTQNGIVANPERPVTLVIRPR